MDDTVKMILNSYEGGLQNYRKSLGDDNAVVVKAITCFEKLKSIGESSKDMAEFSGKTTTLLPEMSQLFMGLSNEKPVHKVVQEVATAEKIAAGYHIAFNSIGNKEQSPETCKVYERIFELEKQAENGIQFLRMITEEGLLINMSTCGLIESSERILKNDMPKVSLPQMVLYNENIIREMKKVKSVAEIDYYSNISADISYYENQWDTMYTTLIYGNLAGAISSYMLSPTEESRQCVEYSYRFLAKYFGINYDEMMVLPRIHDFFIKSVWESVKEKYSAAGVDTLEKFIDDMKEILIYCIKDKPPIEFGSENMKILTFFGKQYHMNNDVPMLYEKAPHPDDKT